MEERVETECDCCGGEIFRNEEYYRINGESVCQDCIAAYAVSLLAPFRTKGGEI